MSSIRKRSITIIAFSAREVDHIWMITSNFWTKIATILAGIAKSIWRPKWHFWGYLDHYYFRTYTQLTSPARHGQCRASETTECEYALLTFGPAKNSYARRTIQFEFKNGVLFLQSARILKVISRRRLVPNDSKNVMETFHTWYISLALTAVAHN